MNKLIEFGRRALFYARVLSGYEERRIRSYRLQLEKRLQQIYKSLKYAMNVFAGNKYSFCSFSLTAFRVIFALYFDRYLKSTDLIDGLNAVLESFFLTWLIFAQERKAALRKLPEQAILSEVRRMVEEMQTLNKKLEETEAAIEEYFKPIDKEAEIIMKIQLEGEEKSMMERMMAMQKQALLEKTEAEKLANNNQSVTSEDGQDPASTSTQKHAQMR
ncbi:hypothetical protein JRO89_XS13G0066100 [Xanthoceras sorbifolium]|uniref:Uncharacterized protein n=1 Tax=Xanthoceras sorbifolium TaxID=99658 RepID=A0ABQ8H6Z1_9ROSI|nr:hypothetical protein JRO89_XS13G0066100 [Xanthoceras sorbifolium]